MSWHGLLLDPILVWLFPTEFSRSHLKGGTGHRSIATRALGIQPGEVESPEGTGKLPRRPPELMGPSWRAPCHSGEFCAWRARHV